MLGLFMETNRRGQASPHSRCRKSRACHYFRQWQAPVWAGIIASETREGETLRSSLSPPLAKASAGLPPSPPRRRHF